MGILEEVLEEIKSTAYQEDKSVDYGWDRAINMVTKIITNHMKDDGWILCSERLPGSPEENPYFNNKKLELYLIDEGFEYPSRAFWNGECFTDGFKKIKAIAWMPLPKKYQLEDKK